MVIFGPLGKAETIDRLNFMMSFENSKFISQRNTMYRYTPNFCLRSCVFEIIPVVYLHLFKMTYGTRFFFLISFFSILLFLRRLFFLDGSFFVWNVPARAEVSSDQGLSRNRTAISFLFTSV